jgi:hypothetical protein
MQFEVTPQGNSDMDFAIYRATDCDNLGAPLRCSYAEYVSPGKTGLSLAAGDLSEDVSGDQWVAELNITAGEVYYIMVNEWNKLNPNAYNIDFTLTNGASFDCTILPVEFVKFEGYRINDNEIDLKWETASETNNDRFEIQKLINGDFETIGIIQGSGNSNILMSYDYTDSHASNVTEYYRLKQVDYDGAFDYSETISVSENLNYKDDINVYPNPISDKINIEIDFIGTIINISLIDISGKEYLININRDCNGISDFTLPLEGIEDGVYLLKFYSSDEDFYYKNKVIIKK